MPLLYFMQALPVSLVQDVASIIYKDLGVANEPITRWTSLVALPWSLQLLLGPLVDLSGTKRQWVIRSQAAITAAFIVVPFVLKLPGAFALSLGAFLVAAIFSSLCNTAMDGFYLLLMSQEDQAKFVGIQTTCYRLGTLFCTGFLVFVSGKFVKSGMDPMLSWTVVMLIAAGIYAAGWVVEQWVVPSSPIDLPAAGSADDDFAQNLRRTGQILLLALSGYFAVSGLWRLGANFIASSIGHIGGWDLKGWLVTGNAFYGPFPSPFDAVTSEVAQAIVCGAVAAAAWAAAKKSINGTAMGEAFGSYFRQSGIVAILAFLMLYRFSEAMVAKMAPLFLKDGVTHGGLGYTNDDIGSIRTMGVIGIVLGGMLGGWFVSKFGLRKSFWPIAVGMHLPNLLYLWAASSHPQIGALYFVEFFEKFGYGFGFSGYIIFQMFVAQRGQFRTAHYALGVGIGALFIQIAGILSGILQANLGYVGFFTAAIFFAIPGLSTLLFIPIDEVATA